MNKGHTLIQTAFAIVLAVMSTSWMASETHKQKCSCFPERSKPANVEYLKIADGEFISPHLNKKLSYVVHGPKLLPQQANKKKAEHLFGCAVVLKNLPIERLGQASDDEVTKDLIGKGMLVVEVDYRNDANATGQGMYKDFLTLFHILGGSMHPHAQPHHIKNYYKEISRPQPACIKQFKVGQLSYRINRNSTYVMPEGCTVTRDLYLVTLTARKNAKVPLTMDVIHPFRSKRPVPALLQVSTGIKGPRSKAELLNRNAPFAFTWAMYGYGVAIMDNVPNLRNVTIGRIFDKAQAVPYGPHFPEKRALRLLRAHKQELQLSGKVIICGISKTMRRASAAAMINEDVDGKPSRYLEFPISDEKDEDGNKVIPHAKFIKLEHDSIKFMKNVAGEKLVGEKDKGPHADQNDRFDGAYLPIYPLCFATSAECQWGFMDSPDDPPAYIALEERYKHGGPHLMKYLKKAKALGCRFKTATPFSQPGLDHNYNQFKLDEMIEYFNSVIEDKESQKKRNN